MSGKIVDGGSKKGETGMPRNANRVRSPTPRSFKGSSSKRTRSVVSRSSSQTDATSGSNAKVHKKVEVSSMESSYEEFYWLPGSVEKWAKCNEHLKRSYPRFIGLSFILILPASLLIALYFRPFCPTCGFAALIVLLLVYLSVIRKIMKGAEYPKSWTV